MGKAIFLSNFQENLRRSIEELLEKQFHVDDLVVTCEDGYLPGIFNGYIDISICNLEKENLLLAIEIEHISGYNQALKNITKLKTWTHNSTNRKCSMLHIINQGCSISYNDISQMVRVAKDNEKKNHGFSYDYIFYYIDDNRKTKQTAEDLVNSMDFRTRLWMLLEDADLV